MNRNNEWREFCGEMDGGVPASVEFCAQRAIARARKRRRGLNLIRIPAAGLASMMLVFVVLMNTSVAFAKTMGEIPPLKELAKLVAGSPSLKAAVDNQYVQPMGLAQEHEGVTVNIAYAIADARRLSLFFSVSNPSAPEKRYYVTDPALQTIDGQTLSCASSYGGEGGLQELQFLFYGDETYPLDPVVTLRLVEREGTPDGQVGPPAVHQGVYSPPEDPVAMASTWRFPLSLDPALTLPGETYTLNQWATVEGQRFCFREFVVYPTGAKLVLETDPQNTAVLQGIGMTLENEKRERWEQVKDGISAMGGAQETLLELYMESSYFARSASLTLTVSRISLVREEELYVFVDAGEGTVSNLPKDIRLDSMREAEGELILRFEVDEWEEDQMFWPFSSAYLTAGGETEYSTWSSTTSKDGAPGVFYAEFSVRGYEQGPIRLALSLRPLYDIVPITVPIR